MLAISLSNDSVVLRREGLCKSMWQGTKLENDVLANDNIYS